MLLSIVLFIICFAFVASHAVFLDCAPLFVVTGETLFLSPKWSGRGIQSRKNHNYYIFTSFNVSGEYSVSVRVYSA